jgi:AcrR family transcriptional regulator
MTTADQAAPGGKRRRVPAMPAEERRAAIIEATIPLLREHGMAVSTRQIAEAAGVAEGTLFGVFPDKPALIREAVLSAFDPQPVLDAIRATDPSVGVRAQLTQVLELLQHRMADNIGLMGIVRFSAPSWDKEFFLRISEHRQMMWRAIEEVLTPHRDLLRQEPRVVAQLALVLAAAGTRAMLGEDGQ